MGKKYKHWHRLSETTPGNLSELTQIIMSNRNFQPVAKLDYGDHGLERAIHVIGAAITDGKRIALYADYDVDGTMSCVSWLWFLEAIGYRNFVHYIPCRFKEGYGLNLKAIAHLIDNERAELIITMDTGITANEEAAYCRERGVEFVCTDHHKIQPDKMPDCIILNPKQHPDTLYQELAGCGITFVLLRKLAGKFPVAPELWTDLLALTGMATICDLVPLNGVNHRLAKLGVASLMKSSRPVLKRLREASQAMKSVDESDVGFRLGPRINAVGRLEHADLVVQAFVGDDPDPLIEKMGACNDRRKSIQATIVVEARRAALAHPDAPILFLGGDWHPGVLGIAASRIAEEFWRPTWLFQRKDGVCKGSARSIKGFDVTACMSDAAGLFTKFGGHRAAGGFTFPEANEEALREALTASARQTQSERPQLWESQLSYDCRLDTGLASVELTDSLAELRPFGHGFEEPSFAIEAEIAGARLYADKTTGEPKHTAVEITTSQGRIQKVMFFNEVHEELKRATRAEFIVTASRNTYRGVTSLTLMGRDFQVLE